MLPCIRARRIHGKIVSIVLYRSDGKTRSLETLNQTRKERCFTAVLIADDLEDERVRR
jgi:hypothetical protein